MKHLDFYKDNLGLNNEEEVFSYFLDNRKDTIKKWDFFINWNKVLRNTDEVEYELNLLNYLVGKENIEEAARYVLKKDPSVIGVIPILIACRETEFKVLEPKTEDIFNYKYFKFSKKKELSEGEIQEAINFMYNSGFLKLFEDRKLKNLVDYVLGVEVGLDSNGRKNRTGTAMEGLVEIFVKRVCTSLNYQYITQATAEKINNRWGYKVAVDKTNRKFDFAINNGSKLYLIETNFYGGGGSKLKSTAGEFKSLFNLITDNNINHRFIWITDGPGWSTTKASIRETFNYIDYLFNLNMLEKDILNYVISNHL